jgi:hypothetical protein
MSKTNKSNSTKKTTPFKEESIVPNVFEKIIPSVEKDNDPIVDTTLKTAVIDNEKSNDVHSDSNEIVDEKLKKDLQSQLKISSCANLPVPSVSVNDDDDEDDGENDDEDEIDDEEFKCEECGTVQGLNNCELCDAENVCEECFGQGGDYGPNEIWVCNNCLPTCNECGKQLFTSYDKCCGKGRSDLSDEEEENDEE